MHREHHDEPCVYARRGAADRLGEAIRVGFLCLGHELERHTRAFELGGDRRRGGRDRCRVEASASSVRDSGNHGIRAGSSCEGVDQRLHGLGQARSQGQPERGLGEGVEAVRPGTRFALA